LGAKEFCPNFPKLARKIFVRQTFHEDHKKDIESKNNYFMQVPFFISLGATFCLIEPFCFGEKSEIQTYFIESHLMSKHLCPKCLGLSWIFLNFAEISGILPEYSTS